MLEIIQNFRSVIDAPLSVVLACPIGVIAALHFASASTEKVKGARCDSVVVQAKAAAVKRSAWIKTLGVSLGLGVFAVNFLYLVNPRFWPTLIASLPI